MGGRWPPWRCSELKETAAARRGARKCGLWDAGSGRAGDGSTAVWCRPFFVTTGCDAEQPRRRVGCGWVRSWRLWTHRSGATPAAAAAGREQPRTRQNGRQQTQTAPQAMPWWLHPRADDTARVVGTGTTPRPRRRVRRGVCCRCVEHRGAAGPRCAHTAHIPGATFWPASAAAQTRRPCACGWGAGNCASVRCGGKHVCAGVRKQKQRRNVVHGRKQGGRTARTSRSGCSRNRLC